MTAQSLSIARRSVLGAALVSVAMPCLAFAQTAEGPNQEETNMKIRISFNDGDFTATL
jgi:hypothetical protein